MIVVGVECQAGTHRWRGTNVIMSLPAAYERSGEHITADV